MAENSNDFAQQLQVFRSQIDQLDNELITLIKRRCEIVQAVGHLKEKNLSARCFIRPAREATMLVRIADQFAQHPFSASAAASIWRLMIAASTSIEQPLKIVSHFAPDSQDCYWLAREYFGAFSNVGKETVAARVIGHIMDGAALVGVLPAFDSGQDTAWWRHLLSPATDGAVLSIFACLPYAFPPSPTHTADAPLRPLALAVGVVDCEPTGNDVSYLVVEGKHELSQSRIASVFSQDNIAARWLQVAQEPTHDSRLHLIELEGFFDNTHPLLSKLQQQCGDALLRSVVLGSHAKPVLLPS